MAETIIAYFSVDLMQAVAIVALLCGRLMRMMIGANLLQMVLKSVAAC